MYSWIRPLLFRLDAERAHHLTLNALRLAQVVPFGLHFLRAMFDDTATNQSVEAFGLTFKNRVGLAAGYDKNGVAVHGLAALGFGHVEVGTVTRQPQIGNPKPRVHRLPEVRGLINSMGFPNEGLAAFLQRRTAGSGRSFVLGVNIGKGKDTPIERAAEDYCELLQQVVPFADYVALNISSPNTMNLRQLQARAAITGLLQEVVAVRDAFAIKTPSQPKRGRALPLLVKIAPDLNESEIDDVLDAIAVTGIDGIIATNTTIGREGLPSYAQNLKGGLSGAPLTAKSTEVIRTIHARTQGALPIIGVGGIMHPADAIEKINAGATLVQVYTGMIYYGPTLARDINRAV
jgi:dihydroorotate dehydrogenase